MTSRALAFVAFTAALTGCVAYSGTTGEYSVGGTVSGLTTNSGVLLTDTAGSGVFVSGNGRFTIENAFADGAAYDLAVASDPGTPAVRCTVSRGQGVIASSDVADVSVECAQRAFTLGGTVSGVNAVGLVLESRGAAIALSKDGSFAFPGKITTGSSYAVTIEQEPDGETCVLTNATGTVESTDVSVEVGVRTGGRGTLTAEAAEKLPDVAKKMNGAKKVVFSRTLDEAKLWTGARLAKGDIVDATPALKAESGPDLVILGSGSIVAQLTTAGLIDEYQLVIVPIVLGSGRTLFEGVTARPKLELVKTRGFSNGNVVLWYARA